MEFRKDYLIVILDGVVIDAFHVKLEEAVEHDLCRLYHEVFLHAVCSCLD